MTRTIELGLNRFPQVPVALIDPATSAPRDVLSVRVKALFHHYFLAKYGADAEDTGVYEYQGRLTPGPDWRFRGPGIGTDKEAKRNVSNELGKAFARWFLYEHVGFTYFCPLEDLLGRVNSDGTQWTRKEDGDLPDYVCGKTEVDVNLLEAKGRYHSVTFRTKEFDAFRAQIGRAQLVDAKGLPISVKGFVGVMRWATEETPRVRSQLLIEDPSTEGEPPQGDGYPRRVGRSMIAGHYVPILGALQLPLHAETVRERRQLPQQTTARRVVWRCIAGPLSGRRFVGGVLPDRFAHSMDQWWPFFEEFDVHRLWRVVRRELSFVLAPPSRFFGVEEHVLEQVMKVARQGLEGADIGSVDVPEQTGSLSMLRDGTVLGPVQYFEPVGTVDL